MFSSRRSALHPYKVLVGALGLIAASVLILWWANSAPRAGAQARSPQPIYLPLTSMGVDVVDLPAAPTAPPSPTATATPVVTPTPTVKPCGLLPDRVEIGAIDVSPFTVQAVNDRRATPVPVMLATLPDGESGAVAWADTEGGVHITPLDAQYQRAGADLQLPGVSVRGFVAHDDGFALLVVRDDEMHLVRMDSQGEVTFDKRLVGGVSQTITGNKWVDGWGHQGRLVFADGIYAAYFGHDQYFGSRGKHQGDLLWFFDEEGTQIQQQGTGWDWGCSHSLDVRLAHNGTRFGPVCLSDAFPDKGFHFNHQTEIRSEPSGNEMGFSAANLGGWVPTRDGFLMSFSSPEGRASADVGLISVGNDRAVGREVWLTSGSVEESAPHLAAYGADYLAGWMAGGRLNIAEADGAEGIIRDAQAVDAQIGAHDDFVALPGGDVGWAFAWGDLTELKIVRVRWCELSVGP